MSAPYTILLSCHLCAKNYQSWWKFDEVLTKTIFTVFWDTVYICLYGATNLHERLVFASLSVQRSFFVGVRGRDSFAIRRTYKTACIDPTQRNLGPTLSRRGRVDESTNEEGKTTSTALARHIVTDGAGVPFAGRSCVLVLKTSLRQRRRGNQPGCCCCCMRGSL